MADYSPAIVNAARSEINRPALTIALRLAHYQVIEARDLAEAARLAAELSPLIMVDFHPSASDSLKFCAQIKSDRETADVPIILVTDRDSDSTWIPGEEFADSHLRHPVRPDELTVAVATLLRARRAQQLRRKGSHRTAIDTCSEPEQHRQQLQRELSAMQFLTDVNLPSPVTADLYGAGSMLDHVPASFHRLIDDYAELLDLALEQRFYRIRHPVSARLRRLSEELGSVRAGPRDVMELHQAALTRKKESAPPRKAQAYLDEGRLLVLELMGYLASYYRKYSLSLRRTQPPNSVPANPVKERPDA